MDMRLFVVVAVLISLAIVFKVCCFSEFGSSLDGSTIFSRLESFKITKDSDLENLVPLRIEDIDTLAQATKTRVEQSLRDLLKALPQTRTFENTMLVLDRMFGDFGTNINRIYTLAYLHPDKKMIAHAEQTGVGLEQFFNKAVNTPELYAVVKDFSESSAATNLDDEQKYFVEKVLLDLKLSGCSLEGEDFTKFKELQNKISEKSVLFDRNIVADQETVICNPGDLDGVSQRVLSGLKKDDQGRCIVGLDYPTVTEIMANCDVAQTRQKVQLAFSNRGYPKNESVLVEIIELKNQAAQLLGFADFAEMNLSDKMAKSPQTVRNFLKKMKDSVYQAAVAEIEEKTRDLPESVVLGDGGLLNPWDYPYLANYYEKKYLEYDQNLVAEYFPVEKTLKSIFAIYEKMLNIRFEFGGKPKNIWHDDADVIKAFDASTNDLLGYIFLDLYPRDDKYSHACCGSFVSGAENDQVNKLPVIFVIANFQKPTADAPSLLKHREVTTFFHEFGHAMHNLLGKTRFEYFSGTSVLRDYVEAPSQMFEEWMWKPEVLRDISSHYITEKPLPDDLIKNMHQVRTHDLGMHFARQLKFALFSLNCYTKDAYSSLSQLSEEVSNEVLPGIRFVPEQHFYANFGHLTGYGAGYYGYMWSLVFAKDLWSEVETMGVTSPRSGELIRKVLAAGGMMHPQDLLTKALGREPSTDAFDKFIQKQ